METIKKTKTVTYEVYKTSDGKEFENKTDAQLHEDKIKGTKKDCPKCKGSGRINEQCEKEQNLNKPQQQQQALNTPVVSVHFSDSISAGKYLREVGRDTDFWFPVHSADIITHANKVWNELNAH